MEIEHGFKKIQKINKYAIGCTFYHIHYGIEWGSRFLTFNFPKQRIKTK